MPAYYNRFGREINLYGIIRIISPAGSTLRPEKAAKASFEEENKAKQGKRHYRCAEMLSLCYTA